MQFLSMALFAAFIVAADQITKIIIAENFSLGQQKVLIKEILSFVYVRNEGAAFGILSGARVFFIILTAVFFIGGWIYFRKNPMSSVIEKMAVSFIAGGAVGNFIDRCAFGYVRDFISADFIDFPVFNVADCFVCIGAALFVLSVFIDAGQKNGENADE